MTYLFDTFTNFLSGLGMPGRDKMTGIAHVTTVWSRDQLENSYRTDWIARKAISIPAHDATREWRSWQAKADQIEKLEATEERLGLQLKLQQALTKARLYGGCCMLIGVDGNMERELDPETIKRDGLKFLHVFAPHQLTIDELEKDITNPYYGQPLFYRLQDQTEKWGDAKIHPSRMVRLIGSDPPDPMQNMGWGDPLMQMIADAVNAAGTVSGSVATLIAEAKLDVIRIPGLTEIFSTEAGTSRLIKRFTEANVAKSVINGIVMDAEEEWQRIGVNFQGMPEILQMYLQIAAGAADIPVTRFLGMSPAGLNSTGESDLINYYDKIASDQQLRLTPALEKLDKAIQRSALGRFDEDIFYEWRPLWQMSEEARAAVAKTKADSAKVDADSGLVPFEALVMGRCNQLIEDGTYPGLEAALEDAIENQELLAEQVAEQAPAAANENEEGMDGALEEGEPPARAVGDTGGPFGLGRFATLSHDRLVRWEEEKHPRVPAGQEGGGQFGEGGGAPISEKRNALEALRRARGIPAAVVRPPKSAEFVSPSVKSGLDFKGAVKELGSRQQVRLGLASKDINAKIGLQNAHEVAIIGAWSDGAENSIMWRSDAGWNETVLAAAMKGHLADQKAVLVFQQQERGVGVLAQFEAKGKLDAIHKNLLKDGIENHTVVPNKDGATVYVVDLDGSNLHKTMAAAERYGEDVYYQTGRAEFIGNTSYEGTDREQRDGARQVYESIIEQSSVKEAKAIWENVRDHWGAPTGEKGYDLTPSAIVAEHPNIKKNSVVVTDAAKMLNNRAGAILKRDLGLSFVDEDNHTPETDEYLANVIALELREGLIGGVSGADWYDKTMKEAMSIAEEIYPELADDPDARFMYTAALAITSQGETVDRNVALADAVYMHYREHGEFPLDIKVKKPSVTENLRKMNEAVDEGGIEKMREFFDQEMTARELFEKTGVEPRQTAKGDMVYGSAMLGPKIGNGFYQNLNGNFKPITMDLWFMRAWGRITNTGVQKTDLTEQLERFELALIDEKLPVPKSKAGTIKVAEQVWAKHEKDYVTHRAEYDNDEREKNELVRAAERLVMHADGMMVEQPKNATQRRWVTSVFKRALEIVKEKHGVTLTPAGAQATWWWPEKILWEDMGVRGKTRDTDYLKSLRALKAKKVE